VFAAQLWYWATGFGLHEDGDDLAVGEAGRLHVELSILNQQILLLNALFLREGYRHDSSPFSAPPSNLAG